MTEDANIDLDEVKAWLRRTGKDRQWLATQCCVSKATVNAWLSQGSQRPIPKPAQRIIRDLIAHAAISTPGEFTLDQYELFSKAAAAEGLTVKQWVVQTLLNSAHDEVGEE